MLVIAHRGGGGLRVENTLAAFGNAIRLGAAGAELDVRLSADGEVVVHHDACLNPAYCRDRGRWVSRTDRKRIADLAYAELRECDIGRRRPGTRYADKFDLVQDVDGERIPLLRDVVRLVKSESDRFFLVIEIKTPVLQAASKPWRTLVDKTLAIVETEGLGDRFTLCSFDWGALTYAMAQRPGTTTWFTTQPLSWYGDAPASEVDLQPVTSSLIKLRTKYRMGSAPWFGGYDPRDFSDGYAEAIAAAGGHAWFMYHRDYSSEHASALLRHGMGGCAWSVNLRDPDEVRRVASLGADAICLDYPGSYTA